jgi:hypothetical protein
MSRIGLNLLLVILGLGLLTQARADSLDEAEQAELKRYLVELKMGRPCSPAQVERLAGLSFPGVQSIMQTYADLASPIEPHTHRAFQVLLERTSREALSPWPMLSLYSPELARFLTTPAVDNPLARKLFEQLRKSDGGRQAFDLAVRLSPEVSLRYLADGGKEGRADLLAAWNRRLALGRESRPLPGLAGYLDSLGRSFSLVLPDEEREAHLRFLASWPALRKQYEANLDRCLSRDQPSVVLTGLAVQHRFPVLLERNEKLVERWAAQPKVLEQAIRNYAFDESKDHSETLRRLWQRIPAEQVRLRYQCLFAMGIHFRSNDGIALQAVLDQAYELLDVALLVLRRGDPLRARQAVQHVLRKCDRGHEEALRLATDLRLDGFEDDAVRIALDKDREQVLRQSALHYLQRADGRTRRKLLDLLAFPKADLRLAAIRMFAGKEGLSAEDQGDIGPSLIRVALADPSMGHRQEAIYAVGCWKANLARDFFRKVLLDNPPVLLQEGYYSDERYWQYRFRLMALLGLARLSDDPARQELLALHHKGGPAEKMDVLLAFLDLGEVPACTFEDLKALEPRLVATAATLIARHGSEADRLRMRRFFEGSPLWREFLDSGIDDHNILKIAGLRK